jgi:LysM repeat protein
VKRLRLASAWLALSALVSSGIVIGLSGSGSPAVAAVSHSPAVADAVNIPWQHPPVTLHLAAAQPATTVVRSGQNLSSIAAATYGNARVWPLIYRANRIRWANIIYVGQVLSLPVFSGYVPPAPAQLAPPPPPAPVVHAASTQSYSDSDSEATYTPSYSSAGDVAPYAGTTYHGSGSMQQCIIARESGGNSQVMNSTGHYGLYQFSASTWAGSGGNPADFGHASVSEQNQVFYNAVAARGYSDWQSYDGC